MKRLFVPRLDWVCSPRGDRVDNHAPRGWAGARKPVLFQICSCTPFSRIPQAQLMRLDSFFSGALCVMSGGRLPAALFLVFLLDSKGARASAIPDLGLRSLSLFCKILDIADERREKRLGLRPRSPIFLCCGKNELLNQAPRISCPLDITVTICHRGECFSLIHSTLLEDDRAPRGRSLLHIEMRRFCSNV